MSFDIGEVAADVSVANGRVRWVNEQIDQLSTSSIEMQTHLIECTLIWTARKLVFNMMCVIRMLVYHVYLVGICFVRDFLLESYCARCVPVCNILFISLSPHSIFRTM